MRGLVKYREQELARMSRRGGALLLYTLNAAFYSMFDVVFRRYTGTVSTSQSPRFSALILGGTSKPTCCDRNIHSGDEHWQGS
jgi:hypothetical protein